MVTLRGGDLLICIEHFCILAPKSGADPLYETLSCFDMFQYLLHMKSIREKSECIEILN